MEDTLITFETAKLAKEVGFNGRGTTHFSDGLSIRFSYVKDNSTGTHVVKYIDWNKHDKFADNISRPTQSLLQKWLREVHNLHVVAIPSTLGTGKWYYHRFDLLDLNRDSEPELVDKYDTYEEALEAGLAYALKLIKK